MRDSGDHRQSTIGLVGPVLPLRGGIAQHTTLLRAALAKRCRLRTLSFLRQYPAWLYPGESEVESASEDPRTDVEYAIDALNPFTWPRGISYLVKCKPAAVIIPWWSVYWTPWMWVLVSTLRRHRIPVLILAHNLCDHESSPWKRRLSKLVLSGGNLIWVHSEAAASDVRTLLGSSTPVAVHPHPIYDSFPLALSNLPRAAQLELLFFGFVRGYKGLDVLIDAVNKLERQDWHLSIVGEHWGRDSLRRCRDDIARFGLGQRIDLVARYVTAAEVAQYFERADFVVTPYRSSSGTGVVPLAYHYDKPVIASDIPALVEIVEDGRTGWLFESGSAESLCQLLNHRTAAEAATMAPAVRKLKRQWSWDNFAQEILDSLPCTSC